MWRWTLVVVALAVAASVLAHQWRRKAGEWERAVQAGLVAADSARAVAREALAREARLQAERDLMQEELEERGRVRAERVVVVQEVLVPDSCARFTLPRDEIIADLTEEVEGWKDLVEVQDSAAAALRSAYTTLELDNVRLVDLLETRPKPRSKWLPYVGVGLFSGVSIDGRPAVGVGLTLTWEVW